SKGVLWHGIAHKVVIPALAAPAIAFAAAFLLLLLIYWVFVWLSPGVANRGFRLGQLGTGTWVAFTHGANDAQKTMGVIALALVHARRLGRGDGGGRDEAALGRALGRRGEHRHRMGAHAAGRCARRRGLLLAGAGHLLGQWRPWR